MKKVLLLGIAVAALLVGSAMAGDYHSGATLNCAECHVMHYSQTHGYNADGTGITVGLGASGPYHFLLRDEVNNLCLGCHDNQTFAPDVLAANGGSVPLNGRQAGGLNRDDGAPYFNETGHTLGSTDAAPGGTFANADGLSCIDCHQQHGYAGYLAGGNDAYRNLLYNTGGVAKPPVTYAIGTNDLTKDVFERSAGYGGDHYSPSNVDFNEPASDASAYGAYCQGCHTDFHGSSVATFNGHANNVQVMDPTGLWDGTSTEVTPSCMTCHKAHGNQNAFGLIFASGSVPIDENGDGANYMALCGQCHVQVFVPAP